MYFHGTWKDAGALVQDGSLAVVAATSSGGMTLGNRKLDLSTAKGLEITAKVLPGNLARFFQVILTDDGKAKDGQSAPKARFQFPLAALSGKNFSSVRADKIAASYYTFEEGDPSKETPIPMERFNFGAVTSVTYQGEFGGTDMRLEVRKVEAVR